MNQRRVASSSPARNVTTRSKRVTTVEAVQSRSRPGGWEPPSVRLARAVLMACAICSPSARVCRWLAMGVKMRRRLLVALTFAVMFGGSLAYFTTEARAFNDKMLIRHKGEEICVDWHAWEGHMHLRHGDALLGFCDVPE